MCFLLPSPSSSHTANAAQHRAQNYAHDARRNEDYNRRPLYVVIRGQDHQTHWFINILYPLAAISLTLNGGIGVVTQTTLTPGKAPPDTESTVV